jgi:uncharacterized protein
MKNEVVEEIRGKAKKYFDDACPSHDWSHVQRVLDLCRFIGKKEGADLLVLEIAGLLHDIGRQGEALDKTLDHAQVSEEMAGEILEEFDLPQEKKENILHCISAHRFRKEKKPETKEAKILFDADKLDCIGAIGVARAYAWAGNKKISLYSGKDYLGTGYEKEHSPVTEFNYKLVKVKDKLFTDTAKKIANERHEFMQRFFNQLNQEINVNEEE